MDSSLNQVKIPTFHRKRRKTHKISDQMGSNNAVVHESLEGRSRRKRREIMKVQEKEDNDVVVVNGCEDHDDDEKAEVEGKILALQTIVPGGESLGVDKLFEETAGYILALQCQIKAMKVLASFLEGVEKEKRRLGG